MNTRRISKTLRFFTTAVFVLMATNARAQNAVTESDTSQRLSFESEFDKLGKLKSQYLIFRKPGRAPVKIEHGLDLPTFSNPEEYSADVARYQRDAYFLRMISIGAETGVIREIPVNLKGDKFRDWMKAQTTIIENQMCSNATVKTEIMSILRNAIRQPPPSRGPDLPGTHDPARPRKKLPTAI